jgi:5,10-methylenetetrahydrofolate reductase
MNSSLAAKIAAKQFVVTGELTPPKGTDLTRLFATAELLRHSVDAINVTESPRARMAMDPRAVAKLLLDRGIESVVQVTSRDRNRIAIQSDLLGAAALGLKNFVFMGGDSPAGGDHPEAKPVFDLTASGL